MSKYKVGDKVVMEIMRVDDGVDLMNVGSCGCSWCIPASQIDRMSEPLSTYTEPLEAKIRRQAAEITRLLRENNELKEQMKFDLPTLISEEDRRRMDISKARAEGQNEAWGLARKIVSDIYHGGYNMDELKEMFGYFSYQYIWEDNTYPEAAAKVEAWEKAKEEIKVGDIVKLEKLCGIVMRADESWVIGLTEEGDKFQWSRGNCTKTGRHIDIDSFLKQIGEE